MVAPVTGWGSAMARPQTVGRWHGARRPSPPRLTRAPGSTRAPRGRRCSATPSAMAMSHSLVRQCVCGVESGATRTRPALRRARSSRPDPPPGRSSRVPHRARWRRKTTSSSRRRRSTASTRSRSVPLNRPRRTASLPALTHRAPVQTLGVNAADINKLKKAGLATVGGVLKTARKVRPAPPTTRCPEHGALTAQSLGAWSRSWS